MKKILLLTILLGLIEGVFAESIWEPLRVIPKTAELINPIIIWLLFLFSLSVLLISIIAIYRKKSQRLMFVTIAFILFFLNSSLNLIDFYFSQGIFMNFAVQGLFDFLIIVSLLIAIFRK